MPPLIQMVVEAFDMALAALDAQRDDEPESSCSSSCSDGDGGTRGAVGGNQQQQQGPGALPGASSGGNGQAREQQAAALRRLQALAADWEWCTVAVYTCTASCNARSSGSGVDGVTWLEEEVAVVNESECHAAVPGASQAMM